MEIQCQPWSPESKYATVISPCPQKGLAVLVALATMLPQIPFLAVVTSWTQENHKATLRRHRNITMISQRENVDEVYRYTKVLLVPSLWGEAYGLVCTEAALRGIPVLSTDHGG